jgi:hypothetical protein
MRLEDVCDTFRVTVPPAPGVTARPEIVRLRAQGYGHTEIARHLNSLGVPTPSGRGQWWPDTVRRHVDPGPWRDYIRHYRRQHR